nr:retrovirus-related Pol polyprotein from transposon TNT 1-94 [Tanacetum cinerariifolium]
MTTLANKAILSGVDNHPLMLEKDMYDSWKSRMELYIMNRQHGRMILESIENGLLIWLTIKENGVTRQRKYSELSPTDAIQADGDVKSKFVTDVKLVWDLHKTNIDQLHAYLGQHEFLANKVRLMHERNSNLISLVATHQLTQGEGHVSRQCTKPKRKQDYAWFKDKMLLVQAQANGQILHEEELAFLADPRIAEVALMENLSQYGLDVFAEVHNPDNVDNNMINQGVQAMPSS